MTRVSRAGFVVLALSSLGALVAVAQEPEKAEPGWAGLQFNNMQNREGQTRVVIKQVVHTSPAETAGIVSWSIVETVGLDSQPPKPVPSAQGFDAYLHQGKAGQTLTLGLVLPSGERKSYTLTLVNHDVKAHVATALRDGAQALVARRAPSGAGWTRHMGERSNDDVGSGITALAARALASLPPDVRKPHEAALDQVLASLVSRAAPEGWVDDPTATAGQTYETYATAETLLALLARRAEKDSGAIAALTSGLKGRQFGLAEGEGAFGGWFTDDLHWQHGGWPFESGEFNRSTVRVTVGGTTIAVEALGAAGIQSSTNTLAWARAYLERSQNWNAAGDPLLADLRDGGFPETVLFSKAGHKDVGEDRVFKSYGSATADGLFGLMATGAPRSDPRVRAAADWLRNHYELGVNPGFGDRPAVPFDTGIHYYYLFGLSRALEAFGEDSLMTSRGNRRWATDVVNTVLARQGPDGAWKNPIEVMDEDNEAIATSFALLSLEIAQRNLWPSR